MASDADVALLAGLRGDDSARRRVAEHELFERYRAPVDRLLRRMLGEDTEDCLQEVFVDVFRGLDGFEGKARLSTWIYRIALRRAWKCAARRRRERRGEAEGEPVELAVAPESAVAGDALAQRFAEALQRLDLEQRTVLALSALENLGPQEIADVLGVPVGTVHSRLSRARQRMRELLGLAAAD
jgi:RNA polymerase sigma-70 factor (ECF subfamily)